MSIFDTSRLVGKTALITGASAGIGAATAQLFARGGSNVVLVARRADKLAEVKALCEEALASSALKAGKGKVVVIEADMQDRKSIDAIPGKLEGLEVDFLINNAGMVRGREEIGDIADADIDVMFNTNVIGLIHLTQIFVRLMKKRNTGTIVNLGSIAGREAYAGGGIYCATKAAVSSFNGSLLRELVNTDIRVCEIQPGLVETEFSIVRFRGDKAKADGVYTGMEPLTGADIAEEIVWVCSRPAHVQIAQMLVFPSAQASATTVYKKPQ